MIENELKMSKATFKMYIGMELDGKDKEMILIYIVQLQDENKKLRSRLEEKNKVIEDAIDYIKNTKNYVYDTERDIKTDKLIVKDKIEQDTINKTKILEILERGKNGK